MSAVLRLGRFAFCVGGPPPDPTMTISVTTTGASQTLTLAELRTAIGEAVTVTWGDGQSDIYTSTGSTGNARTHLYASAGTYTVTFDRPDRITHFDVRDTKISQMLGTQLSKMVNLTNFRVLTVPDNVLQWTVGPAAPMFPLLQYLQVEIQTQLVWTVAGDFPPINDVLNLRNCPGITWTIDASNPIPSLVESLTIRDCGGIQYVSSAEDAPDLSVVRIEDGWSQAEVDAFLRDLYLRLGTRNVSGDPVGTVDLLGGSPANAAPSGVFQAAATPTTGKEYAYALLNAASNHNWSGVTTA